MGKLVGSLWARRWAHCGHACGYIVGTPVGIVGTPVGTPGPNCGHAYSHIVGTVVGTLSARLPSFSNKANSSCVLHIPPVNKRSETKRVLIQLATEGWGVAVLLIEQPFKSTTPTCDCLLGSLVCTIENDQQVCLGVYGTENAVPFLEDNMTVQCILYHDRL